MSLAAVCAVLPALNEADALPHALAERPSDLRVIVVDNGSEDGTADVARSLGVEVVSEPRRGFGAACQAGLDSATTAEIIVFMDADATCTWADVERVVEPIREQRADLVLGRRVAELRERGSMAWHISVANSVLARACGYLAGTHIHDVGPLRAIRRDALVALGIEDRTYGWPLEMVLRAGRQGLRVIEVPVHYRVRVGTSKVTGTLRGTLRATRRMMGVLWDHRR